MKIKLLIATGDTDYAEYLSNALSEKYADSFDVNVCTSPELLHKIVTASKFDAALAEQNFAPMIEDKQIQLSMILVDETKIVSDSFSSFRKTQKYQRVSALVGDILENYADIGRGISSFNSRKAHVTAVWSPAGGVGKTSISLAFAAYKALNGKQALYLDLESFSSISVYFQESGKSISKVFEKLESNISMMLLGIRQQDSKTGISYFCGPENYDDISVLSADDIEALLNACGAETEELIIDLSCQCDERTQRVLSCADTVLLVCDSSNVSRAKMKQFITQHNVFEQIQNKTILINNRGSSGSEAGISKTVNLPTVQSADPGSVYKALSGGSFDW